MSKRTRIILGVFLCTCVVILTVLRFIIDEKTVLGMILMIVQNSWLLIFGVVATVKSVKVRKNNNK